jgi:mRNA interferase RelE/StbE
MVRRRLRWSRRAERDLEAIERQNPRLAQRIRAAARLYADEQRGDVVKLTNRPEYRLRVGDWRVIFSLEEDGLVVLALRVLRRNEDTYR